LLIEPASDAGGVTEISRWHEPPDQIPNEIRPGYCLCDSREGHPAIFKQCVFHIGAIHEFDFQKALRHAIQLPVLRELMEEIGA
jgi:hypothetical protein